MFFDTSNLTYIKSLGRPAFLRSDLLVSSPNQGGLFLIRDGSLFQIDNLQSSGLWLQDDCLYRSLQHPDHLEIIVYDRSGKEEILAITDVCDIHDIRVFEGNLLAVSTSTNEVVRLSKEGEIIERWQLPGEGDAWHVNCLADWDGRLVASAFGQSRRHREWKGQTSGQGIVFDLKTKEILWRGLNQPHSPRADKQGNKYICDSANRRICIDCGEGQIGYLHLPAGYTRGLLITPSYMFVGLSQSRNINLDESGLLAGIAVIDRKSMRQVESISLPVIEIYDILAI